MKVEGLGLRVVKLKFTSPNPKPYLMSSELLWFPDSRLYPFGWVLGERYRNIGACSATQFRV